MSSIEQLLHFLLKDGGKNLEKYLGRIINGRTFKATKSGVINQFWDQSSKESHGFDDSVSGKAEFNKRLNTICPEFFEMKIIMKTRKTASPCVSNSNIPLVFSDNDDDDDLDSAQEDESNGGKDAGEGEGGSEDEDCDKMKRVNGIIIRDSVLLVSEADLPSSLRAANESKEERAEKKLKIISGCAKWFQDAKVSLLELQYERDREDKLKIIADKREERGKKNDEERLERLKKNKEDQVVKMLEIKARLFRWSEEKFDKKYTKYLIKQILS
ncbi:hypothetical protein PHYBLDRAFT_149221 [Phycomyces blakesleeanus NRRL 1555(-)]|uniref:Uncharacterized protein n=1 Tax=Phycomyces blakesleeanus (strain ATCC 8743b / DSM 1359 / FGSC 10004 / NBRC 33097 / NRRL 1555) TaxID=763407 RepID=A0A162WPE2_PHYB8|nr:hypothetical protein PHYBLDRAFT_149221 [Phycomyces blakesleeanus NRRL 1555(-)]OAD69435.1 hypothetical protein PHYBLDRAFT_149221 [Phycomyces blakesleeanus NRRL 1555(-)]|eukprot:XP_018287475.1 hypothetical protein PHYBLDRAFT_149221 [Phycomyces blakesleeanus NRRL 1555(-)]